MIKIFYDCLEKVQKLKFFFVFLGMLITALLEMISIGIIPLFIAAIVDLESFISYLPSIENFASNYTQKEIILAGSLFLLTVFLLKNLMLAIQYYNENNLILSINKSFAVRLFKNYLKSNYLFFIKKNTGFFIRNLTSEINNTVSLAYSFMVLCREGLVTLVIIFVLVGRNPSITLLLIFMLSLTLFFFFKKFKEKIKQTSSFAQELRATQMQLINQSFGLFKTVKIFNLENILSSKFNNLTFKKERSEFYLRFIKQIPRLLFELVAITSLLLLSLLLVVFYSDEHILITLSTLAIAVVRLVPAFNSITSALAGINELKISFKMIYSELNNENTINRNIPSASSHGVMPKINNFKSIFLDNVNFKYDGQKNYFIKNLSLNIKKGDNIALVGKSGSGKTTLVDIIIGLLNIDKGNYILNNENIMSPILYWKSKVGYVAQDVYLIDDTIRANVTFSEHYYDENVEKKIENALKKSAIFDFVQKLPNKDFTKVGERGAALSGGQRQRLAFARAIYSDPEMIIMDEATSALDDETEQEILTSLDTLKKDKTVIVIAHKLKTISSMDKVILMENGNIKFFGDKDDYVSEFIVKR